jgi:hypothetical protein
MPVSTTVYPQSETKIWPRDVFFLTAYSALICSRGNFLNYSPLSGQFFSFSPDWTHPGSRGGWLTPRLPLPCPWPAGQGPARPHLTGSGSWTAHRPAGPENNNSGIWRLFLELKRANAEILSPAFTLLTGSGGWTAHHPTGSEINNRYIWRLCLELLAGVLTDSGSRTEHHSRSWTKEL